VSSLQIKQNKNSCFAKIWLKEQKDKLGMVMYTCNLSIQEMKAGAWQLGSQPVLLHSYILSQKAKNRKQKLKDEKRNELCHFFSEKVMYYLIPTI
jgi:hypothetical protein